MSLVVDLVRRCLDYEFLNSAATAGAFRSAWDSEPYLDGVRWGSYFSAASVETFDTFHWSVEEIVETWGGQMMTHDERRRFAEIDQPLTIYRGGAGDPTLIAQGVSWTTDIEVARFYASAWPKRWGVEGPPIILRATIERDEAVALLDDRQESEILVDRGVPFRRVVRMP